MVEFIQATPGDILSIEPQSAQSDPKSLELGRECFRQNLVPLDSVAIAIHYDGKCIGAYGIVEVEKGVGHVWALFSEELLSEHWLSLARRVKRDLALVYGAGMKRAEVAVNTQHEKGAEFLEWLGFKMTKRMPGYFPNGEDACLYERARDVV